MTRRKKIFSITLVLGAVLAAVLIILAVIAALRPHPLDVKVNRNRFPVKGIDVSHHNGCIDFEKVRRDSVDFVIIKATDGIGHTDPNLYANYNGARSAGLKVGVYHFFRYHRDGHAQAQYFMDVIDTLQLDLPVAIDLEDTDNESGHGDMVATRLRHMVDDLKAHGYRVMIYSNRQQYETYVRNGFPDTYMWRASSQIPESTDSRTLWQHSHLGQVQGIRGYVDLNTFNGTEEQYLRWITSSRKNP